MTAGSMARWHRYCGQVSKAEYYIFFKIMLRTVNYQWHVAI